MLFGGKIKKSLVHIGYTSGKRIYSRSCCFLYKNCVFCLWYRLCSGSCGSNQTVRIVIGDNDNTFFGCPSDCHSTLLFVGGPPLLWKLPCPGRVSNLALWPFGCVVVPIKLKSDCKSSLMVILSRSFPEEDGLDDDKSCQVIDKWLEIFSHVSVVILFINYFILFYINNCIKILKYYI